MDYPLKLSSPESDPLRGGSSDVGDVTLVSPTVSMRFPVRVPGSPGHHWTVVAASNSSIAHKGLTAGAKVLAFSAFDLLTRPAALAKIREEFSELAARRPYKTFLPAGAQPPLGLNTALMEKYRGAMEKYYINP